MHFAAQRVTNRAHLREIVASMAIPVRPPFSGASRRDPRASALLALVAITLCGCSFDLGSWSAPEKEAPAKAAATAEAGEGEARIQIARGQGPDTTRKTTEG